MRVFELSKEVGMPSKELITLLSKMGIAVKSHMTALTDDDVKAVMKQDGMSQLKNTAKKSKRKKQQEPEPPPPPKKRFVLRKKKVSDPEPVEAPVIPEPVVVAEVVEEAPPVEVLPPEEPTYPEEPTSPEEPASPETVAVVAPVKPDPKRVHAPGLHSPVVPVMEEEKAHKVKVIDVLPIAKPPVEEVKKKAPAAPAVEKKLQKPETTKAGAPGPPQKDAPPKQKEKTKRVKRVKWNPTSEEGARPAGEARKWQDFKPLHRRDDRKSGRRSRGSSVDVAKPRRKVIKIFEGLTVKEFSELTGQKVNSVMAKLMELGKMATINQAIDLDEAVLLAEAFELNAEVVSAQTEEDLLAHTAEDDPAALRPRPPVITIMGHVDHGKTSLLDVIRQTKVTDGEAGGITQHIGAYTIEIGGKSLSFLDTPGHEAFTAMRARGAQVTDIVVLVVAADDGVMPQTIEAIKHAKLAKVPIIVAVNKMDRPDANADRVRQALSEYELISEEWGGDTIFAEVSAKQKTGIEHLLEMIQLQSEVLELQANPEKGMVGTIIEAKMERGRGPVATVLVQEGTLRVGDAFVTGNYFGKVRALITDDGKKVKSAGPSTPVEVIGLDGVPTGGDTFVVVVDERAAKEVASSRAHRERTNKLNQVKRTTLDDLYGQLKTGEVLELNVIIKADVQGSVEALQQSLEKLSTDAVKLRALYTGVGNITESDILLAAASRSIVIGFNVKPEPKAKNLAPQEKVDVRLYSIIYEVIDEVRAAMEGLLAPIQQERILGQVEVRQTFSVPKLGVIAGGYVREGVAQRNCAGVRVIRGKDTVFDGKLASLRRFKDDVKEVQTGYECGIGVEGFTAIEIGDTLELYVFDQIAAKL